MGIFTRDIPSGYVLGLGRDVPHPSVAHLYKGTLRDPGQAMCKRGYNRPGGYSIWRGNMGVNGVCEVCLRRARAGKPSVTWPADAEDGEA